MKQKYKFLRNRIKLHFLFEILMGGMESGDISRSFKAASKLSTDLDLIEKMMQICIWSNVRWIIYQINNWKCMEIKIFIILEKITFTSVFLLIISLQGRKRNSSDISCIMIWYDTIIFNDEWEITDKFGTKPYSDGKPAVVDNVQAEISCLIFHQMFFLMRDLVSR